MVASKETVTKRQVQRLLYLIAAFFFFAFIGNSVLLGRSFYYRTQFLNEGIKTSAQILTSKRISPWQIQISLQVNTGGAVPFTTNYDVGCSAKTGCGVSNYPTGSSLSVYYISQPRERIEFAGLVENSLIELIWLGVDIFLLVIALLLYRTARRAAIVDGIGA